jgi:hypothetical protein
MTYLAVEDLAAADACVGKEDSAAMYRCLDALFDN